MNFDTLFQQQNALPTIPKVVQELIDSFNNDTVSIEEIAKKLAADQVLSAKLLRLANSSYYHASRSVGTVDDASPNANDRLFKTGFVENGSIANQ